MQKEPTEKCLDRHYQSQLRKYDHAHKYIARASDQAIIVKWLEVFDRVPKEQKLARNSLMMLMYGHLKEFGYLLDPFVDMANLDKDLNVLLDGYTYLTVTNEALSRQGNNNAKPSMENVIRYVLRNPVNNEANPHPPPKPKKSTELATKWAKMSVLQPIEELTEISEMEPSSNRITNKNKENHHQDITYDSHRCYKPKPEQHQHQQQKQKQTAAQEEQERKTVRDRIKNYEQVIEQHQRMPLQVNGINEGAKKYTLARKISISDDHLSGSEDTNEAIVGKSSGQTESSNSSESRPRAVRSLKVCFDEMADTIRSKTKFLEQYPNRKPLEMVYTRTPQTETQTWTQAQAQTQAQMENQTEIQAKMSTTKRKISSTLPTQIVMHQESGHHLTEKLFQLRKRNEELRQCCLKYYNPDGSLKQQRFSYHSEEIKGKQRTQGFLIGAHRALKRLRRWRGLPQRLSFFATCFGQTGLGLGQWRWGAIDRRLEKATHKWYRNTLQHSQQHAWRSYRRIMLQQNLPKTAEAMRLLNQVLNSRRELILERMSHLQQLKQLCAQECAGRVNGIQLQQMLKRLEDKYLLLAKDLHSLACQQQQQQEQEQEHHLKA